LILDWEIVKIKIHDLLIWILHSINKIYIKKSLTKINWIKLYSSTIKQLNIERRNWKNNLKISNEKKFGSFRVNSQTTQSWALDWNNPIEGKMKKQEHEDHFQN
jgi:hypothetical protein